VFIFSTILCAACAVDVKLPLDVQDLVDTVVTLMDGDDADQQQSILIHGQSNSGRSGATRLSDIEAQGTPNACFLDEDHYVAEFLYQNPDTCFWSVDSGAGTISAEPVPQPPRDAVRLPRPSGRDDTRMIQTAIDRNPGGAVVGSGVYQVSSLKIKSSIDIFNMPMTLKRGAHTGIIVNAPDVRIFDSPIDAKNSATARFGYFVEKGAHRFTLVNSGFSNARHTRGNMVSGVFMRGVDDFHLACNTFENLTNRTSNKRKTARANAIWMNGRNRETTSGGYIVNNSAYNLQSNGTRKDAEFFTIQNFRRTDANNPVRIFGNRAIDAGKRFSKHQEDNALVLSNYYEWRTSQGPLGKRPLLAHVGVLYSSNIAIRNNRVKVGNVPGFDYILNTYTRGNRRQSNIHYDCNDIEVTTPLPSSSKRSSNVIVGRVIDKSRRSTGFEAINSSANNNRIHGAGSIRNVYWFGNGYNTYGGSFQADGNSIEVDVVDRVYKR